MSKSTLRSPYETLLALCVALIIGYLIFKWPWAIYASAGLGLTGLLSKSIAALIHHLWQKITLFVGMIMTHILLFIVFYLLLFPISVLYKMAGKAKMKMSESPKSNYLIRNHTYSAKDLENMW